MPLWSNFTEGDKVARVPYLDDTTNPELKALCDRIRAERGGRVLNLYRALLNSPKVAEGLAASVHRDPAAGGAARPSTASSRSC